jgi:pimeloyl-ACP methyl ester carboxylesterase
MRGEFVDVGGTRLYYYAAGSRGGGDPVVFLHGFPGSSHSWRQITPLMPEGRRLVVMDLMGCGRSDGPQGRPGSIATHAALVRGLLDDLAIARTALVGHGLGGAIAQALTLEQPKRISGLALISSFGFEVWPRRLARLARAASPLGRWLGGSVLASFVHGSAIRGYADRDEGRRSLDHSLRAYATHLGADALVAQLEATRDPAIQAIGVRLGELAVPTAVICGADDPFLPRSLSERLQAAIHGATLDVIPGAGHFVMEDAPERCATAIHSALGH